MYCRKMVKFFNWIKRVFVGWYNVIFHKESEEAKRRLQICMECQDKIKIGKNNYICGHCGCVLKAKCASPEEKCSMDKW